MSYAGMNAETGRWMTGIEHLSQSVVKVLTTTIGSRTQRRPFGSKVPDLIDQPGHQATLLRLYAMSATAVMRWEPRVRVKRVSASVDPATPGSYGLTVEGEADGRIQPFTATASIGQ
jgi:phage baseplate assembly protein W